MIGRSIYERYLAIRPSTATDSLALPPSIFAHRIVDFGLQVESKLSSELV